MSYRYKNVLYTCVGYDMFKRTDLSVLYTIDNKTRFSAVCKVTSLNDMPVFDLGVVSKMNGDAELRGKISSNGEVSGCYKVTVDKRISFCGSLTIDASDLNHGNHRTGVGMEFIF